MYIFPPRAICLPIAPIPYISADRRLVNFAHRLIIDPLWWMPPHGRYRGDCTWPNADRPRDLSHAGDFTYQLE
jgi:hypothetical protein